MKKSVIVSGGSKGIGAAIVRNLTESGYKVYVLSRSVGEIYDLVNQNNVEHIPTDISNLVILQNALNLIKDENIWAVVNNCAGPTTGPSQETTPDQYLKAISSHLLAADIITKYAIPHFTKNNGGRVLNIISVTARVPLENMIISNSLRGAMLNWSKTLSKELGSSNITVNNILPGYTYTQRLTEVINSASAKIGISNEDYSNLLRNQIPLKRFGKPEELANVANFLISELASYVNGVSIPVDGGWTPCP